MTKANKDTWTKNLTQIEALLQEVIDIQQDWQNEHDEMPDKAKKEGKGDLLEDLCNVDLSGAMEIIEEAVAIELP